MTEADITQRLQAVRALMRSRQYDALIVPRADEYLGEYIPERNERLRWLTDFTGSAGAAVVLADAAAIFVDGRYTVQVREQVSAAHFAYHSLIEDPPLAWLIQQLGNGTRVACDPRLHSAQWLAEAERELSANDITLAADADNVIDACWHDRPPPVVNRGILLSESFTGESSPSKRQRLAAEITEQGCAAAVVFAPDSVSWLLNVRGTDMPQLPVLLSSALLVADGTLDLFVEQQRLPEGFAAHVGPGVRVHDESAFADIVFAYKDKNVLIDPVSTNGQLWQSLVAAGATPVPGDDPVALPKACKNATELSGTANAHLRDAVAEVRFLAWLDAEVDAGRLHDEAGLAEKLLQLRAEGEHFHALSFDTISAAGANAAMCHYNHLNGEPAKLPMNSTYLFDSGGQYLDGTTDITRTVAIGDPGAEVRRMFTLVLKGHIALDSARFPPGTTGMQLDALARQFLWANGYDFDHGTGHGVGVFLSVHEGPQRIAKTSGNVALQLGMIVSNEPGYYRDGEFGIRCENLVVVQESPEASDEKPMLEFRALTLVPFDTRMLDRELLTAAEVQWLNRYHACVRESVGPLLSGADYDWLLQATEPVAA